MPANLEILLKLDGIVGESTAEGHTNEIDVVSYEQAINVTVFRSGGGGSTAGRATFPGVRFRKCVDAASIPILVDCASGKHLKSARFTFRRSTSGFDFYVVTLDDVLITHVAQRAGTGEQYPLSFETLNTGAASDGFLDEVTLEASRIHWEYRRPNAEPVKGGWDIAANRPLH